METKSEQPADAKPLVFRKERKFLVKGANANAVEFIIKAHPAMFSQPFPPRFVNNIYFDSSKFSNYGDNVMGAKNRTKFRIRWYGDQFGLIKKPVLEIKVKKGLAGAKHHFPLVPFTFQSGFDAKIIARVFEESRIPKEVWEMINAQSPTLVNRYFRKYFLSADHKFRLTVDTKLKFIRIGRYQNSFLQRVSVDNQVIIELKYDIENDLEAKQISNLFPFRLTKSSKYVSGVDHLDV